MSQSAICQNISQCKLIYFHKPGASENKAIIIVNILPYHSDKCNKWFIHMLDIFTPVVCVKLAVGATSCFYSYLLYKHFCVLVIFVNHVCYNGHSS